VNSGERVGQTLDVPNIRMMDFLHNMAFGTQLIWLNLVSSNMEAYLLETRDWKFLHLCSIHLWLYLITMMKLVFFCATLNSS